MAARRTPKGILAVRGYNEKILERGKAWGKGLKGYCHIGG